ncbi:MAG: hypothetical protein J0I07_35250 [Myxococcales bacterium]|nr:hypothetical protein [Myxococcales bacterium]
MRGRRMPWILYSRSYNRRRFVDIWLGAHLASEEPDPMDRDELLRLLLPLWGVAFVAGFLIACR